MRMACMQSILLWNVLATLLIVVTVCSPITNKKHCNYPSHHLILGELKGDYKLLVKESVELKDSGMGTVQKTTVVYPPKGKKSGHRIKYIKITDYNLDGTGGCPMIEEGGIGEQFVKIVIESQPAQSTNLDVEIYGEKIPYNTVILDCTEDSSEL